MNTSMSGRCRTHAPTFHSGLRALVRHRPEYAVPVAREAIRKKRFENWNADAAPMLDALDAARRVLKEAGYHNTSRISFWWPDASAHEDSTKDARQALLGAATLNFAQGWIAASVRREPGQDPARPARVSIEAINPGWLTVEAHGEDVGLVERMFAVAVAEVDRASPAQTTAEPDVTVVAPEPEPVSAATAVAGSSDHAPSVIARTARGGVVGWMESHPALTGVIATGLGIAAAVAIAIAEK